MKIEVDISDDRELRAAIRDAIKGEVSSIMRGEIRAIITDLVKEGSWPKDVKDLDEMVRKEIGNYVRSELKSTYGNNIVREIATMEIRAFLKEIIKNDNLLT